MGPQDQSVGAARIFISLPTLFATKCVGVILEKAGKLGLDARVYHGIPKSPPPQINNAEYEARAEMYSAIYVFAAFAIKDDEEIDGDWIIKYLPKLRARDIYVDLGLVGVGADNLISVRNIPNALSHIGASIKYFSTPEEWLAYLFDKLHSFSCPKN